MGKSTSKMTISEGRWPDFLIIGAAKAGTTAIYHYLRQHPGIYACPVREPNFFGLDRSPWAFCGPGDQETIGCNSVEDAGAYLDLFEPAGADQQAGEVSPLYLYSQTAAARIQEVNPSVKLIVLLRHPVERAYASYLHLVRDGREKAETFEAGLEAETERIAAGWEHLWHYRAMGRYADQLERYLARFDRRQILVMLHEHFRRHPKAVLEACFSFLDVDPTFKPDLSRRPNRSGIPRYRWVHRALSVTGPFKRRLVRWMPERLRGLAVTGIQGINLRRPPMNPQTRKRLLDSYREDMRRLETMIGQDLSHWSDD